jgi:hypothetical protein
MKSLLPNCRFLTVASEHLGKDWAQRSQEVDEHLDSFGMELAEESIFLLYDRAPGAIMAGEGRCQVARSIIGPKKRVEKPFQLIDWVQAAVYRRSIKATDWNRILEECYSEWEKLHREGNKIASPFMVLVKRRLSPELNLTLEVLFHE